MHRIILSLLTAVIVASAAHAQIPATQPTAEQYQQLKDRLDRLEARQTTEPAPFPQSPPQALPFSFRTTPANVGNGWNDVVSSISGDWNGSRFTLSSADGNFTLHPGAVLDIRNMTTYRTDVPAKYAGEVAASGYNTQNGFDLSRARFILDGTLFHQGGYFVQFTADQGASLTLLDAVGTYHFGQSPFTAKVGQFKDPVWHERNVSESNLLAVDRTLTEYYLAGGQGSRIQGAAITYDQDRMRAQLVAHDGFNTQNTKFFDSGGNGAGVGGESGVTPTNFGFSGRAEYMLIGKRTKEFDPYNEYEQFSSLHLRQDILVAGGGLDYSQASSNDLIAHSADLQFNSTSGLSMYAAYLGTYRGIHTNQGVAGGYYYDSGFLAQAGYLIGERLEPFARYDWTHFDPSSTRAVAGLGSHLVQELTVGANYYVFGQKLKVTVDGSWLPNGSPGDADALGVLRDSGHQEFMLRTQLQIGI